MRIQIQRSLDFCFQSVHIAHVWSMQKYLAWFSDNPNLQTNTFSDETLSERLSRRKCLYLKGPLHVRTRGTQGDSLGELLELNSANFFKFWCLKIHLHHRNRHSKKGKSSRKLEKKDICVKPSIYFQLWSLRRRKEGVRKKYYSGDFWRPSRQLRFHERNIIFAAHAPSAMKTETRRNVLHAFSVQRPL